MIKAVATLIMTVRTITLIVVIVILIILPEAKVRANQFYYNYNSMYCFDTTLLTSPSFIFIYLLVFLSFILPIPSYTFISRLHLFTVLSLSLYVFILTRSFLSLTTFSFLPFFLPFFLYLNSLTHSLTHSFSSPAPPSHSHLFLTTTTLLSLLSPTAGMSADEIAAVRSSFITSIDRFCAEQNLTRTPEETSITFRFRVEELWMDSQGTGSLLFCMY